VKFPLSVESEFLFADIWNHVPSDLNLREAWTDFRLTAELHYLARLTFLEQIRTDVQRLTGLPQDNSFSNRGYTSELPTLLFRDTFRALKHGTPPNTGQPLVRGGAGEQSYLAAGSQGLVRGNQEDLQRVEAICKNYVTELQKDNPTMFKSAQSLVQQESKFLHNREMLVKLINEFLAVPIYSRRCKYVKRSEGTGRNLKLRRPRRRLLSRRRNIRPSG